MKASTKHRVCPDCYGHLEVHAREGATCCQACGKRYDEKDRAAWEAAATRAAEQEAAKRRAGPG